MKAQRCNYGDIPGLEQYRATWGEDGAKYSRSAHRRILGFQAGNATLVMGPKLVGHESGVFLRKPLHLTTQFLTHPATSTLFFRGYLLPFCIDWSIYDCIHLLDSPPPSVSETTEWFPARMSGVGANYGFRNHMGVREEEERDQRTHRDARATWGMSFR